MSRASAERDRLTNLLSRRAFEEHFLEEAAQAFRDKSPLSLVFVDIDRFKALNDTHGHAAGDAVISIVAGELQSAVGEAGVVARYGGEEFAILLPRVEKEQAFLLAERIRASLEAPRSFSAGDGDVRIAATVSSGVAAAHVDGRSPSEIARKADQALYRAKTTGRNKVCIAQEERMATKTTHYTLTQLERLARLAKEEGMGEAVLLREALDDLLIKYRVSEIET